MGFKVSYVYEILNKYTRPLAKITASNKKFQASAKRSSQAASNFAGKMNTMGSAVGAVAGIVGGASVLNTFNDFEVSMNKLGSVTLANEETFKRFRDTAKDLGATTQFSAGQAAQGMTFLAMAGLDADQVLKAIPGTLKLAAAGGMDLASAADIATNVLAQMGLKVEDLARVNDVLARVQSKANTDIFQMAEALKNVGTSATAMGISIEEQTALLGAMANAGIKGGEAGTLLRNSMKELLSPTAKANKIWAAYSINLKKFVTPEGKVKNFSGLVKELTDKGVKAKHMFELFGDRGVRAMQALQSQGKPAIDSLTDSLLKAGGTADKMATIQMRGLPGVMKTFASAWEAVQIAVFESGLDRVIMAVVNSIADMFRWLSKTSPSLLILVGIAGTLLAALAPVALILGTLASLWPILIAGAASFGAVMGVIFSPITLIVGAILALVAGITYLVNNWEKVKSFFSFDAEGSVAAQAAAASGRIDGTIGVSVDGPGSVTSASMETDMPGNLGMNMLGA